MLVFFSVDCYVCWEDLFEMKFFVEKNRLPVRVVGITKDPAKDVVSFLMKYSFSSPVVCDRKKELFRKFKVDLEPFIIIVLNGEILYMEVKDSGPKLEELRTISPYAKWNDSELVMIMEKNRLESIEDLLKTVSYVKKHDLDMERVFLFLTG